MKTFFVTLSTFLALALASPTPVQHWHQTRLTGDTATDFDTIVANNGPCADTAVIFARGTFDSGNIGVWVGPQFQSALSALIPSVAFQGVDPTVYAATLEGYLGEDGPDDAAQSLADSVNAYAAICPSSKLVVSGWSQGALVAHKGIALLSGSVLAQVKGFVTFGDPASLFGSAIPDVPSGPQVNAQCFTGTTEDPLCGKGTFALPKSISDITGPFSTLPTLAVGTEEAAAAAELVADFPGQLLDAGSAFTETLVTHPSRLLLSPQHFMYGNAGLTGDAAAFVAGL
uniref:cutinase n=1 Tax=Mycena chlorophos TaxID=658473 RepID=A0ABQ0L8T5_MYCCL|nr:carbohydrate esterase family 5 protein [Mycena chlorophos]